ncbi:MAG TPA: adenylyltransferase/cytidyltransferase family protein, partial [Candidatus Cloacimonadota bacterium]|nr:adenylyltransferase/cytidyltransferase family protein [Candidatus Cloacimonadota bacterium]
MRKAIYPGTFDPITNGHINILEKATRLFDEIVLAVANITGKDTLFSTEER